MSIAVREHGMSIIAIATLTTNAEEASYVQKYSYFRSCAVRCAHAQVAAGRASAMNLRTKHCLRTYLTIIIIIYYHAKFRLNKNLLCRSFLLKKKEKSACEQ